MSSTNNQPSRLRWFRKPFPTAGNSCLRTGCDLINTALYFSFLLNVTAAAAGPLCPHWGAAALLCPARAGLLSAREQPALSPGHKQEPGPWSWQRRGLRLARPSEAHSHESLRMTASREPSAQLWQTVGSYVQGSGASSTQLARGTCSGCTAHMPYFLDCRSPSLEYRVRSRQSNTATVRNASVPRPVQSY